MQYHSLGLAIIPCSGKVACVKWGEYQEIAPTHQQIRGWFKNYSHANIAIITGEISNLTVIDIDSGKPDIIKQTIKRFGDTPIKIKTPSGGMHLYYRYRNESCHTRIDGLPVDVRAKGGYVIAPPSINPDTGQAYSFWDGNIKNLKNLPFLKMGSLNIASIQKTEPNLLAGDTIYEGQRNNSLYKALLNKAKEYATLEDFEDAAFILNETFMIPPLPEDEVMSILQNVWRLKISNKLYGGGERFFTTMSSEIRELKDHPRAFWLLMYLKDAHENRRENFSVSVKAIAECIGWDASTIREARNTLLDRKYIELIHEGGNKPGDPHIFRFYKGAGNPTQ